MEDKDLSVLLCTHAKTHKELQVLVLPSSGRIVPRISFRFFITVSVLAWICSSSIKEWHISFHKLSSSLVFSSVAERDVRDLRSILFQWYYRCKKWDKKRKRGLVGDRCWWCVGNLKVEWWKHEDEACHEMETKGWWRQKKWWGSIYRVWQVVPFPALWRLE